MAASVPVVDLSLPIEDVTQHVRRACTDFGFFYVVQHGVDQDLIDRQFEENRKLFALPLEVKMQMLADQNNRGYTPYAEETLNPSEQTEGDTKEGFYFGREVAPGTLEGQKPLHGPNQWPSKKLLPDYQTVIEHYFHALHHLGMRLLQLLARALELEPTFFDSRFDPPMLFLRPLHYGVKESDPGMGVFGAGAHTDYGMLTILATDEQPGLQVLLDGEWVDVPPKPGTLIINLGDMLERWTNGTFRSALHRVVNQTGEERYSTAFFFEPSFDTLVECLPQCCRDQVHLGTAIIKINGRIAARPPRFPPTTAGQHLLDKYAATHSGYRGPTVANEVARINTPVGAAWD